MRATAAHIKAWLILTILGVTAGLAPPRVIAAGRGEPGPVTTVRIELRDRVPDLKILTDLDIDVDGVFGSWARAHVLDEEADKLRALGFVVSTLLEESPAPPEPTAGEATAVPSTYHTYETLTLELQQIAADHPEIARVYSIGKSVRGRDLWIMKITDAPDVDEDEPEVRYIAAMHGDEVVGKEMCINLINLLTDSYGSDPRITDLVQTTEIWILPSMNPDGTASARRYNANFVDLNRDFPDQFHDPVDTTDGREPETRAVMDWTLERTVVLSANFHGGALVANYGYDGNAAGNSVYTAAPDDSLFVSLARTYADNNPPMYSSNADSSWDKGICNGADWYVIYGGLQDWSYVWRGGRDLTLEVSTTKWPAGSQLPQFWEDNRESMLALIERVHQGVRGVVTDAVTGSPVPATLRVVGNPHASFADPDVGDYHRPLLPGRYDLEVSAVGYVTKLLGGVVVDAGTPATRVDVELTPLAVDLQPVAHRVLDGPSGDGFVEAGETADLAVTVRDLGEAATGISARLVPTGWYAATARSDAVFPDLTAGGSGESLAPHYAIALDGATPAGHKAGFALAWSSDQGAGTSEPFFVPTGAAACDVIASTDVPKAILDRQTAASSLGFAIDREISEVDAWVEIRHTYIGDLHVRLVSPSGTPVTLHGRSGGSADDIIGWYDTDLTSFEPLSRLEGENALGTWRLEAADGVPLNAGTIANWSLRVCGRPIEASPPEMKIREVAKTPGGAVVTWWPYPGLTGYRVYRSTSLVSRAAFADVTAEDPDPADTRFEDATSAPLVLWLVTGVGANGEGAR